MGTQNNVERPEEATEAFKMTSVRYSREEGPEHWVFNPATETSLWVRVEVARGCRCTCM